MLTILPPPRPFFKYSCSTNIAECKSWLLFDDDRKFLPLLNASGKHGKYNLTLLKFLNGKGRIKLSFGHLASSPNPTGSSNPPCPKAET